jgi:hypothetical protein
MGHMEPSGSTHGTAGLETADPETGTPTPSPTPSVTPSPPPHPQEPVEAVAGEDDDQRLLDMNPPPVLQNGATDCLPIDQNLSHLLVRSFVTCKGNVKRPFGRHRRK